jgi:D-glycero-D-manno-heptose 1,7-bisphosphate phosphatase
LEKTIKHPALSAAVFLDRDGTINKDEGYVWHWGQWQWLPGVPQALVKLKNAGFKLAVVSNQAGIAKGLYTAVDVRLLHQMVQNDLKAFNLALDGFYFCPHHPDYCPCSCRKPSPGMIFAAQKDLQIDLKESYLVGDKLSDVEAGLNAGLKSYLVRTGYGLTQEPLVSAQVMVADDLSAAADLIIKDFKAKIDPL